MSPSKSHAAAAAAASETGERSRVWCGRGLRLSAESGSGADTEAALSAAVFGTFSALFK